MNEDQLSDSEQTIKELYSGRVQRQTRNALLKGIYTKTINAVTCSVLYQN